MKSTHTREYGEFLKRLKAARADAQLTQHELAQRLKRPQSFVSKYENAERRLDVVEFLHVSAAIGIDPCVLLDDLRQTLDFGVVPGRKKK